MENQSDRVVYEIDSYDRLVFVNDAWDQFAIDGNAPELLKPDVLGKSLWEFIKGETIESLYKEMLVAVRNGSPMVLDFRCDSPRLRRFLEMHVSSIPGGGVRFEITTTRVEERAEQEIFTSGGVYTDEFVVSCSWCKKIRTGDGEWNEIERASELLGLFGVEQLPQISHGMCETCYDEVTAEFRKQA